MKRLAIIFALMFSLTACELIHISSPKKQNAFLVNIDQNSALGTVYLFKAEIDSGYIIGAAKTLAKPDGSRYLPIEKLDLYGDIQRIAREIKSRKITNINIDTLAPANFNIAMEFDYTKIFNFRTIKIDDLWYISEYIELNQ